MFEPVQRTTCRSTNVREPVQRTDGQSTNAKEHVQRLLEMIRFSHTLFALPFALLAAVMAWTAPPAANFAGGFHWQHLLGIVLCMVFARSAAMAFNRLVDRKLDAANPRTAGRHLPAGTLSVTTVSIFLAACSTGFLLSTALFLPNILPAMLALPVLAVLLGYSYAKRFTSLAHVWLGAALMLAPVSAWIAIRGEILWSEPADITPALLLGCAVLLWVTGFDVIYACQDYEHDKQAKLHSIPAALGVPGALRTAAGCHLAMLVALALLPLAGTSGLGPVLDLGLIYWLALAAVAALLIYEHSLVRPNDLARVNRAFFHVNALLSVGLFVVGSIDLLVL